MAAICFIVCHGGPADHFATFSQELSKKGYQVEIYASGPALQKLQSRTIEPLYTFSLEESSAIDLAKRCAKASVVITDVGHGFDLCLQEALREEAPQALRLAYYDNPESYVPGGYSEVAAKVMRASQGVLFANANLATSPIYEAGGIEVDLGDQKRFGIGYYPIDQAAKILKRRETDRGAVRAQFFATHGIEDQGQEIFVYAGGNNEEYFSKAFPAFLRICSEAKPSNAIWLLQQHPGAKEKDLDGKLARETAVSVPLFISQVSSEEAMVLADRIFYYQTSMGPQFVLAGIPTVQIGHNRYEDVLVRNGLCPSVTKGSELLDVLKDKISKKSSERVLEGLGICPDWLTQLDACLEANNRSPARS